MDTLRTTEFFIGVYMHRAELNHMAIEEIVNNVSDFSNKILHNESEIISYFNIKKPIIWKHYSNCMYNSLENQFSNHECYKHNIQSLDDINFLLLDHFNVLIKSSESAEVISYFLEQKMKSMYFYLLYTYSLKRTIHSGTWHIIHNIYFTCLNKGCKFSTSKNLESLYKKCLILAILLPYNINKNSHIELIDKIDFLSSLIFIESYNNQLENKILIDSNSDSPVVYCPPENKDKDCMLMLNVNMLIKYITTQAKQKYFDYLRSMFYSQKLNKHNASALQKVLNVEKNRLFERTQTNIPCSYILSFSDAWYYLQKGKGNDFKHGLPFNAIIFNKSETGFCLEINGPINQYLQHGEIIGLKTQGKESSFSIGIISWTKEIHINKTQVGIEKLALNPLAIKCHYNGKKQPPTISFLFKDKKTCLLAPQTKLKSHYPIPAACPEGFEFGKEYEIGNYKIFELI